MMCRYRYLLFDLDGTLTDPGLGITNSVMYLTFDFQPSNARLYVSLIAVTPNLSAIEKSV